MILTHLALVLLLAGQAAQGLELFDHNGRREPKTNQTSADEEPDWRWRYIDEFVRGYRVLVAEETVDARLANLMYTVTTSRITNQDWAQFNMGSEEANRRTKQLAAGKHHDERLCGLQLAQMLAQIRELEAMHHREGAKSNETLEGHLAPRHVYLAQTLDSFGHYDHSLLAGKYQHWGSWTKCMTSKLELEVGGPLTPTRYCIARYSLDKHLDESLRRRQRPSWETQPVLVSGLCLPAACHSVSFDTPTHRALIRDIASGQFRLPRAMFADHKPLVSDLYCHIDETSELTQMPPSGRLWIWFMGAWFVVLTITSLVGVSKGALGALSVRQSWEDLTLANKAPRSAQEPVDLDALNPVKVFGCMFIIVGHSFMLHSGFSTDFLRSYAAHESEPDLMIALNAPMIVDTFYVITGLLMCYLCMRKFYPREKLRTLSNGHSQADHERPSKPRKGSTWFGSSRKFALDALLIVSLRFVRIIPLFFIMFWYKKSVFPYLGWGPNWDYGTNLHTTMGACQSQSWWTPFTPLSAYLPLSRQCMPHSWSVASDLFFSIILAPLILLLCRAPAVAILAMLGMCAASNLAVRAIIFDMPAKLLAGLQDVRYHAIIEAFNSNSLLYTAPHFRINPVVVGTLAGYALFHYERKYKADKSHRWPRWLAGPASHASLAFIVAALSLLPAIPLFHEFLEKHPVHKGLFVESQTSLRLLWAIANAVVFVRLVTDWSQLYWIQVGASKAMQTLTKLNYSILFIHVEYLTSEFYAANELFMMTRLKILTLASSTYMLSVLTAAVCFVTLENPLNKLIKALVFDKLLSTGQPTPSGAVASQKAQNGHNNCSENGKAKHE